jgi:hypothetical protein
LSEHQPVCFLSSLPFFDTLFLPLMFRPTQCQRASPWSRGLYFHSIIICVPIFSFYNGLCNSPDRL